MTAPRDPARDDADRRNQTAPSGAGTAGGAAGTDAGTGEQEAGMEPPRTAVPPAQDWSDFDRVVDGQPTALGET